MGDNTDEPKKVPDTVVEETWAFAGVRLSAAGKLTNAWALDSGHGKTTFYPPSRGEFPVIGANYRVRVDRGDDQHSTMYGSPQFDQRTVVDAETIAEWTARATTAKALVARKRRERDAAKQDALKEAMAPLLKIARTMPTRADRDAFVAVVIRHLWSEW